MLAPDGNGFLATILGITDGTGSINRFSFEGADLGTFASVGGSFREATAMAFVSAIPEPGSLLLVGLGLSTIHTWRRRRMRPA